MAFPFTDGGNLPLTAASVAFFAAAALVDAARRGALVAGALLVVAGGGGLVAEAVGVRTDVPFGAYSYAGTLGPQLLGVPALVPLAWVSMTWPALVVARRLTRGASRARRLLTSLVGAWALTAWDVFLDPQMVDLGHWTWADPTPSLPGVTGIPLTNFAGWLLVSWLFVTVLDAVVPDTHAGRPAPSDAVPVAVYLWTFGSSVLAHAAFFGRPPVALVGGLLMGLVAVPLAVSCVRETRGRRSARGAAT
jgi:putative membrane protein